MIKQLIEALFSWQDLSSNVLLFWIGCHFNLAGQFHQWFQAVSKPVNAVDVAAVTDDPAPTSQRRAQVRPEAQRSGLNSMDLRTMAHTPGSRRGVTPTHDRTATVWRCGPTPKDAMLRATPKLTELPVKELVA